MNRRTASATDGSYWMALLNEPRALHRVGAVSHTQCGPHHGMPATHALRVPTLPDTPLAGAWRKTRHEEPPENPASPSTTWSDALAWAAVSGIGLGVARLVAQRGAAAAWQASTETLPAQVQSSGAAT